MVKWCRFVNPPLLNNRALIDIIYIGVNNRVIMAEQKIENKLVNKWRASEGKSLLEMSTGYKTSKDIPPLTKISRKKIHTALLAAGMTPGLGNVADAADALLYAAEGEFGSAGLSIAAMTPMVGQLVSAKRALKAAREAGEEFITVYRGVPKWFKGKMVKEGKFVGNYDRGSASTKDFFHTSMSTEVSKRYGRDSGGVLLEFKIPKSYVIKHGKSLGGHESMTKAKLDFLNKWPELRNTRASHIIFEGLPKEFLKKVHR